MAAVDTSFRDFVLDQLADLGGRGPEFRRMFGGGGLWLDGRFFGILWRDRLYLRTAEADRDRYAGRGMGPFQPGPRQVLRSYWEVPADVLEDAELLCTWARDAIAAAAAAAAGTPPARQRGRTATPSPVGGRPRRGEGVSPRPGGKRRR